MENQPAPQLTPFDLGFQPSDSQAMMMNQQNQTTPSTGLPNIIPLATAHLTLQQLMPTQDQTAPAPTAIGGLQPPTQPAPTAATTPTAAPDPTATMPDTIPLGSASQLLQQLQGASGTQTAGNMAPTTPNTSPTDHLMTSQWGTARNPTDAPIQGPITQEFGTTAYSQANPGIYHGSGHNGIDIGVPTGTKLPTNIDGTILQVGDMGKSAYGKYIVLQGSDGVTRLFGHLSQQDVVPGQKVAAGTLLGLTGSTGDATGPHLHYSEFTPSKK